MNVLLVATVQSHIAQFHLHLIKILKEHGYCVHVAARNNLFEKNGLRLDGPDQIFDVPFSRFPLKRNNIKAYKMLKRIIVENDYAIIHCNTPVGGVITRLITRNLRSKVRVFYTVHGFHFYHGAPLKNWLLYYPIEKFLAYYTDKLITISLEDYQLAINLKLNTKIERIHGVGVNTDKYFKKDNKKEAKILMGYDANSFICLCTGELNHNKNQKTLIHSIPMILFIPKLKLLLAGNGPLEQKLRYLIQSLNLENYIQLIGYRTDLEKYVAISDCVISASIREGLGLNILEAMSCGVPVIASNNRGHREVLQNGRIGTLVPVKNSEAYAHAILDVYNHRNEETPKIYNALSHAKMYSRDSVVKELKKIYGIGD